MQFAETEDGTSRLRSMSLVSSSSFLTSEPEASESEPKDFRDRGYPGERSHTTGSHQHPQLHKSTRRGGHRSNIRFPHRCSRKPQQETTVVNEEPGGNVCLGSPGTISVHCQPTTDMHDMGNMSNIASNNVINLSTHVLSANERSLLSRLNYVPDAASDTFAMILDLNKFVRILTLKRHFASNTGEREESTSAINVDIGTIN